MAIERTTVFGGTGFLGRRIAGRLQQRGLKVRVASRHPDSTIGAGIEQVSADVTDAASLAAALNGTQAAVNAVALYVETRDTTFEAVHVAGARNLAEACRQAGLQRLVQISGIGADTNSSSPYVRARGKGEVAAREAFEGVIVLRPSVLFAEGDAFLTTLLQMVRLAPVIPLFGSGATRLQPVFADDVAEAVVRCMISESAPAPLHALGGPEIYSYRELLELVMQASGRRRPLLPLPFALWHALAFAGQFLQTPPLTEGQVALMSRDNVAPPDLPGLDDLGISPVALTAVLSGMTGKS